MYLGDYAEDYADLNFKFTTRAFTTGVPTTLAGTPAIAVYKSNATATEKTSAEAYITLSVDFDSVTGLNNVKIDLSGDAFFATGNDYAVVITTGTVGGVSVVGETVATFSIQNRYMRGTDNAALASVLGALTDAAAAGDPTATDTAMQYLKQLVNVLVGADGVTTMPAAAAPANNVNFAEMIRAIYDDTNEAVVDTADMQPKLGAPSVDLANDIATIMTTQMTESYNAAATAPTPAQALFVIMQAITDFAISGTTKSVKTLAGTAAFTETLDDATNPTTISRD